MDEDLDADDFIAYASIPVSCLRTGWRCIQLFDANGSCLADFEYAKLFIRIYITAGVADRDSVSKRPSSTSR